jgi:tetratricopeptide (TPR) repeat protein
MNTTLEQLQLAANASPCDGAAADAYASALVMCNQHDMAVAWSREAVRRAPDDVRYLARLARRLTNAVLGKNGGPNVADQIADCLAQIDRLTGVPEDPVIHRDFGLLYLAANRNDDAARCFVAAVTLRPRGFSLYLPLAEAYLQQSPSGQRQTEALLRPWKDLFDASVIQELYVQGRYAETCALTKRLAHDDPSSCASLVGAGLLAFVERNVERGRALHEQAFRLHPQHPLAAFVHLYNLCASERYIEAGEILRTCSRALRWTRPFRTARGSPSWKGEPLEGRSILLTASPGFGDTLQFVRFVRMFRDRGADVILECQPALASLVARVGGVSEVIEPYAACRPHDYECCLEDAWLHLGLSAADVSAFTPYLHASSEVQGWANERLHLDMGLRVGVAWQGSRNRPNPYTCRAMPLADLEPLTRVPGVALYSLQVGQGCEQIEKLNGRRPIVTSAAGFEETAALIAQLDVVVTIDTSIVHLAGGLGKTTFLLLPYLPSSWRWPPGRDRSPWYGSVTQLWQGSPGDWSAPVARVADQLARMSHHGRSM